MNAAEKCRRYRLKDPQRFKDSQNKYLKKKIKCTCGRVVTNAYRPQHLKTKIHLKFVDEKEVQEIQKEIQKEQEQQEI